MEAQSFQTSINGYTVGDTCIDLYAEQIMIPRISLLSAMTGLLVLALFLIRCHRRRRTCQLVKLLSKEKRWFAYFLAMTVAWLTIFLCCFNSSIAVTTSSMSGAQVRPRIVFSFTTTTRGIAEIQQTVDALVHQEGDGFDIVPSWLLDDNSTLNRTEFRGITFATGTTPYHAKSRLVVLDTDFGPASKVLGTLLIEHDPDTLLVYGDDDRLYPPQLCERSLYYTRKYPNDAIAVLGGWISAEDELYCGCSLAVGVNSVSFVGGAGGVVVQRKFFGMQEATMSAFRAPICPRHDFYLPHLLSRNGVRRRLLLDIDSLKESFSHGGLSHASSEHPGGANVEHYQQCIREIGKDQDLSYDGEFGSAIMFFISPFVLAGVIVITCFVQDAFAMNGELRIYKEPEFKRLRRIIKVSTGNLCYDMRCADLSRTISSARWTGLPATGSTFAEGHVKIAFYAGSNCTGKSIVLNTSAGEVRNLANFGMDIATTSFAVLQTSTVMKHATSNICE
ncbi:hypothetical protein DD238_006099 [Peronospora effusa]|uniref:Uncharacterized protein n=1 Tax=Peronospora effusa TaxID=542832 RepID=A0A3M6VB59_9STRA|nr:hypothetical protein DD238_006099 [Peronospora effusa]